MITLFDTRINENNAIMERCKGRNKEHACLLNSKNALQNRANISFGGKLYYGDFVYDMRELADLTCACCNVKMLRNSKANNLINKKIYYPAKKALSGLKNQFVPFRKKLSGDYETAFNLVKSVADKNPKTTMSEIFSKKSFIELRQHLTPEENLALDKIREMSKYVSHTSKYMIKEIDKLNPKFRKVEKKIYKELKKLSQKYPDETFFDILNRPYVIKKYIMRLEKKQNIVLEHVADTAQKTSCKTREHLLRLVRKSKKIFGDRYSTVFHKRSLVIHLFDEYCRANPELTQTGLANEIMDIICRLPNSKTDVNAFMAKGLYKSSNSIIETLIKRIANTNEHVKPHHRVGDNGPSLKSNYISLCGKCNEKRMRTGYNIFANEHPEMKENTQKQINKVIKHINSGRLLKYDTYPNDIKPALDIESKGIINIEIDKLDLEKARKNRQILQDIRVETLKSMSRSKK